MTWGGGANIVDVVDEILSHDPNAAGVAINWQLFGSNGQETADYSRGVLVRFTRRAPRDWSTRIPSGINGGNIHVKTLANPRKTNFVAHPHYPIYFEGCYSVNERGKFVQGHDNNPVTADKIVIHHYYAKSREEFFLKQNRGQADTVNKYGNEWFDAYNRNDEFDDGILRYCMARVKNFKLPDKSRAAEKLLNALMTNLSPTLLPNTPPKFFAGKMETFLTCRAVSSYLKSRLPDDAQAPAKFFEEASLKAILRSLDGMSFADARLLIRELPNLLTLPYPAAEELRAAMLQVVVPQMMNTMHLNYVWRDYFELDYIRDLLKLKEAE